MLTFLKSSAFEADFLNGCAPICLLYHYQFSVLYKHACIKTACLQGYILFMLYYFTTQVQAPF
jgi:hypothetical protein